MEKLAKKLTDYIVKKKIISREDKAVYYYGFQMGLDIVFNLLVSVLIAILLHRVMEAILFFLVFIPIRSFAGGFHFEDSIRCFALSVISYAAVLVLAGNLDCEKVPMALVDTGLLLLVRVLYPVQTRNRILDDKEKMHFLKKLRGILLFDLLLVVILMKTENQRLLNTMSLTLALIGVSMVVGKIKFWWQMREREGK